MRIQEHVTELGGEAALLDDHARGHLAGCEPCSQVATAEARLQQIFEEAVPPADHELQDMVLKALSKARLRRRVLAFLPVAASLLVAILGAAMLGGVPGGSLLALLPLWSSHGWMGLTGAIGDWQIVASAAATSMPGLVTPTTQVIAALLFICGLAGVGVSVRRWRKLVSWRRND